MMGGAIETSTIGGPMAMQVLVGVVVVVEPITTFTSSQDMTKTSRALGCFNQILTNVPTHPLVAIEFQWGPLKSLI